MPRTNKREVLMAHIYDAAIDRSLWPGVLESIRQYAGVTAVTLVAVDRKLGAISFSAGANTTNDGELAYIRKYCALDPRMRMLIPADTCQWIYCHEHLGEAFVRSDPFYQEMLIPLGLRYVAGNKVFEDENVMISLALHQAVGESPVTREHTNRTDEVVPHLQRAIRLSISTFLFSVQALVGVEIVNRLRYPVFLLSDESRIIHMNPAAVEATESPAGVLRVRNHQKLVSADPQSTRVLENAVLRCAQVASSPAAQPSGGETIVVSLSRGEGERAVKGFVTPLQPQAVMGVFGPRQVIMAAFSDPTKSALPEASFLMAAYGLSPAEARVALLVAQGRMMKEVADELGVKSTTARTQLESVYRKTSTSKQSELVAELFSLPDMRISAPATLK